LTGDHLLELIPMAGRDWCAQMLRKHLVSALTVASMCAVSYFFVRYLERRRDAISEIVQLPARAELPSSDPKHPCGPTCLALVGRLCGHDVRLDDALHAASPDRMGRVSVAELVEACRKVGLHAVGVKIAPRDISNLQVPVILHTKGEHFVVALANRSGQLMLLDPPDAPRAVGSDELALLQTGMAIVVSSKIESLDAALATLGLASSKPH
jgi:ABC-type bacteriocin/lantibiotic exporter with double-glycine peptidase domain